MPLLQGRLECQFTIALALATATNQRMIWIELANHIETVIRSGVFAFALKVEVLGDQPAYQSRWVCLVGHLYCANSKNQ